MEIRQAGRDYSREHLPRMVRAEALERLEWHRERGDRIVVVSASLDAYLSPWCSHHGFDLICTRLASRDGTLTGRYSGGDCSGAEKARRILGRYRIQDFGKIYAYGDTDEDREMLGLAHERYFRWQKVA